MSFDIAIKVQNLSKSYHIYDKPRDRLLQMLSRGRKQYFREFWALRDVSFEIMKGETVGIIGRNGSGKSTLLQIICGTLNPSIGDIEIKGRIAALLELGAGFNPEFSGRENIYLAASLYGLSVSEVDARFDEIAEFADIGDFMEQPVKTYSSGMYVRLAFSVIAHVDADILVIDEALAVGDVFFTQKCMRFLKEFKKNGTILFVTHDTNSVLSLCERSIWLNKGSLIRFDKAKIVCESYLAEIYSKSNVYPKDECYVDSIFPKIVDDFRDVRQDFINCSSLRNDLEVFRFSSLDNVFGSGLVKISDAFLKSLNGDPVSWFVGGELVELSIIAVAMTELYRPIIGFLVKDKLGQNLFGDNTFLSYVDKPMFIGENKSILAKFRFRMPLMPSGDYTIGIAVADGTQDNHIVHQWIHDAIFFKSHSSSVSTGLIGIPMLDIELNTL